MCDSNAHTIDTQGGCVATTRNDSPGRRCATQAVTLTFKGICKTWTLLGSLSGPPPYCLSTSPNCERLAQAGGSAWMAVGAWQQDFMDNSLRRGHRWSVKPPYLSLNGQTSIAYCDCFLMQSEAGSKLNAQVASWRDWGVMTSQLIRALHPGFETGTIGGSLAPDNQVCGLRRRLPIRDTTKLP